MNSDFETDPTPSARQRPASGSAPAHPIAPSGVQYEIRSGEYIATIVEVGGGVRSCDRAGRAVLDPFAETAMCDGARGTPLVPWPNRLGEGKYSFDGIDYQVAIDEPDKNNALHGLLRWRSWQARQRSQDHIVMGTTLHPMQGYPFALDVEIDYQLGDDGLSARTTVTNVGDVACPYGSGQHPYLSPGEATIDECQLQLAAATRVNTSPERQLPVGMEAVLGTEYDFTAPTSLAGRQIDYAFCDLQRDSAGLAWARLHRPDGRLAQLWVDESYSLIEIFTGDTLEPDRRRRGLGVEPMTCPPNALQSGQQVIRLEPGQSHACSWGVQLTDR